MHTQVYTVDKDTTLSTAPFPEKWRVFMTFVKDWEELYLESDEYTQSEVVKTTSSSQEDRAFLDSLKK